MVSLLCVGVHNRDIDVILFLLLLLSARSVILTKSMKGRSLNNGCSGFVKRGPLCWVLFLRHRLESQSRGLVHPVQCNHVARSGGQEYS
ncbi:hypothetical protein BGZ61DRAFT_443570 [Ilyonectria robusta]|uniref:uncharacterized protein n=1 Tax=Ilyonectria robusta TaxID=1079257 RepID=UPI001E8EF0E1|nr:uncharacterized protein BGZ61DRAFT_443570 [Ilyonectria robusta]KAH8735021.1 hypothetical protein BGZ61DRAFT_443570 [Ilyonectria robusta]